MQQCNHGDVRFFPVVDTIDVDGRTINIMCAGDYEEACRRLFRYMQSIPVNGVCAQERMITNGVASNATVADRAGAFCTGGGYSVGVGVSA